MSVRVVVCAIGAAIAVVVTACNSLVGIEEGRRARVDGESVDTTPSDSKASAPALPVGRRQDAGVQASTTSTMSCTAPGLSCGGTCIDPTSDVMHCGGCGRSCPSIADGQAACVNGSCDVVCGAEHHRCGDACVSDQSPLTCGSSCTPCPAAPNEATECSRGRCEIECVDGFGDCDGSQANGCETRLDTVIDCGRCGVACLPGQSCVRGVCT